MTRRSVGGVMDLAALSALADQHRDVDQTALAREARRLIADGLSYSDIAAALHLSTAAVADLLAAEPEEP